MSRPKATHNAANEALEAAMREGPRPFNLHLFTTACMLTAAAMPLAADPQHKDRVLTLVDQMTGDMMEGLKAYRAWPCTKKTRTHDVLWEEGSTRLLRMPGGAAKTGDPVLLVPSLINRFDIMDLDPQHSFAAYLAGQGYDVYILDWGAPGKDETAFTIDTYITQRLYPAFAKLGNPHVIGYCMGGTMAAGAIAAAYGKYDPRSLTLLAAPWDFHAGDQTMKMRMNAFALSAGPVMETTRTLPVDWIQALFASIDPLFAFNKFRSFAKMEKDSQEARRFVMVEDWLNDGVDLTAGAANQAMQQWYIENQPANGVWTLGKGIADASYIKTPTFVVAAGTDKLVPKDTALAIGKQIVAAQTYIPDIGHIGMMASPRAAKAVWQPIAEFLKKH